MQAGSSTAGDGGVPPPTPTIDPSTVLSRAALTLSGIERLFSFISHAQNSSSRIVMPLIQATNDATSSVLNLTRELHTFLNTSRKILSDELNSLIEFINKNCDDIVNSCNVIASAEDDGTNSIVIIMACEEMEKRLKSSCKILVPVTSHSLASLETSLQGDVSLCWSNVKFVLDSISTLSKSFPDPDPNDLIERTNALTSTSVECLESLKSTVERKLAETETYAKATFTALDVDCKALVTATNECVQRTATDYFKLTSCVSSLKSLMDDMVFTVKSECPLPFTAPSIALSICPIENESNVLEDSPVKTPRGTGRPETEPPLPTTPSMASLPINDQQTSPVSAPPPLPQTPSTSPEKPLPDVPSRSDSDVPDDMPPVQSISDLIDRELDLPVLCHRFLLTQHDSYTFADTSKANIVLSHATSLVKDIMSVADCGMAGRNVHQLVSATNRLTSGIVMLGDMLNAAIATERDRCNLIANDLVDRMNSYTSSLVDYTNTLVRSNAFLDYDTVYAKIRNDACALSDAVRSAYQHLIEPPVPMPMPTPSTPATISEFVDVYVKRPGLVNSSIAAIKTMVRLLESLPAPPDKPILRELVGATNAISAPYVAMVEDIHGLLREYSAVLRTDSADIIDGLGESNQRVISAANGLVLSSGGPASKSAREEIANVCESYLGLVKRTQSIMVSIHPSLKHLVSEMPTVVRREEPLPLVPQMSMRNILSETPTPSTLEPSSSSPSPRTEPETPLPPSPPTARGFEATITTGITEKDDDTTTIDSNISDTNSLEPDKMIEMKPEEKPVEVKKPNMDAIDIWVEAPLIISPDLLQYEQATEDESELGYMLTIKSGTLNKLIECLTPDAPLTYTAAYNTLFRKQFLTTFPTFTTPDILFNKLLSRFNVPSAQDQIERFGEIVVSDSCRRAVQTSVLGVFVEWVRLRFVDFTGTNDGERLMKELQNFMKKIIDLGEEFSSWSKQIADVVTKQTHERLMRAINYPLPTCKVDANNMSRLPVQETKVFRIGVEKGGYKCLPVTGRTTAAQGQLLEKLNMQTAEGAKYGIFLKRKSGLERLLGEDDLIMAEMAMDDKLYALEKDVMRAPSIDNKLAHNPQPRSNVWDPSIVEIVWFKKINMFIRVTVDTPRHDYKGFKAIAFDKETKISNVISSMCEKLNLSSTEASAHGLFCDYLFGRDKPADPKLVVWDVKLHADIWDLDWTFRTTVVIPNHIKANVHVMTSAKKSWKKKFVTINPSSDKEKTMMTSSGDKVPQPPYLLKIFKDEKDQHNAEQVYYINRFTTVNTRPDAVKSKSEACTMLIKDDAEAAKAAMSGSEVSEVIKSYGQFYKQFLAGQLDFELYITTETPLEKDHWVSCIRKSVIEQMPAKKIPPKAQRSISRRALLSTDAPTDTGATPPPSATSTPRDNTLTAVSEEDENVDKKGDDDASRSGQNVKGAKKTGILAALNFAGRRQSMQVDGLSAGKYEQLSKRRRSVMVNPADQQKLSQMMTNAPSESNTATAITPALLARFPFLKLGEEKIAKKLLAIDFKLFTAIQTDDLLNQKWIKRPEEAPHVLAFIDHFNMVAGWVVDALLQPDGVKDRAIMMDVFVRIAQNLATLRDYSSVTAILSGLNDASVLRLKHTYAETRKKTKELKDELEALVSPEGSYRNYRQRIKAEGYKVIPYIGVSLSDLTFIEEGNPKRTSDGMLNFTRCKMMYKQLEMVKSQQLNSDFDSHVGAASLSEARAQLGFPEEYLSSTDLYQLSLELEPRGCSRADVE